MFNPTPDLEAQVDRQIEWWQNLFDQIEQTGQEPEPDITAALDTFAQSLATQFGLSLVEQAWLAGLSDVFKTSSATGVFCLAFTLDPRLPGFRYVLARIVLSYAYAAGKGQLHLAAPPLDAQALAALDMIQRMSLAPPNGPAH